MAMNPETNTMEPLAVVSQEAVDDLRLTEAMSAAEAATAIMPGQEALTLARAMDQAEKILAKPGQLVRPNGEPIPEHWSTYKVDEEVVIKRYRWRVAHIGERHLLLEPVGPVLINKNPG